MPHTIPPQNNFALIPFFDLLTDWRYRIDFVQENLLTTQGLISFDLCVFVKESKCSTWWKKSTVLYSNLIHLHISIWDISQKTDSFSSAHWHHCGGKCAVKYKGKLSYFLRRQVYIDICCQFLLSLKLHCSYLNIAIMYS